MHADQLFPVSRPRSPISHRPRSIPTFHPSILPTFHSSILPTFHCRIVPPKMKFKKQIETIPRPPTYPSSRATPPTYTAPRPPAGRIECYLHRIVPEQIPPRRPLTLIFYRASPMCPSPVPHRFPTFKRSDVQTACPERSEGFKRSNDLTFSRQSTIKNRHSPFAIRHSLVILHKNAPFFLFILPVDRTQSAVYTR
jgi:hypothetical protein